MENLPRTPEPTPAPIPESESTRSLSEMPSFEEHMASKEQAKITPEAKERILQAAVYRDEASRRRLDFAAEKGLSIDEQDRILDKEIAIEDADKKLIEDLASDDGTVASMEEKLKDSIDAVNEATKGL